MQENACLEQRAGSEAQSRRSRLILQHQTYPLPHISRGRCTWKKYGLRTITKIVAAWVSRAIVGQTQERPRLPEVAHLCPAGTLSRKFQSQGFRIANSPSLSRTRDPAPASPITVRGSLGWLVGTVRKLDVLAP